MVKVVGTGKDADSLRVQLIRVCKHRGIDSVTITVRNRELYLEKE